MGIYIPSGQPPVDQFAIGDMRITYRTVEIPGSNATIVGVQSGSSLRAYTKQDAARTMGRTTPRDNTAEEDFEEMGEQEAKRVQAMLSGEGPSGQKPNCCQIFGLLSSLFARLLLMVMRHVVGTEVLLLSPLEKSVSGMFFSEQLRIEKVHACAPPQWHSLQMHTNPPLRKCTTLHRLNGTLCKYTPTSSLFPPLLTPPSLLNVCALPQALSSFRIVGTILFILSFYLILHPIAALFSFIPFLGKLISSLFLVAAIVVGLFCSLSTILAAWMVVKPLRAFLGFACVAGLFYLQAYLDPLASISPVYTFGGLSAIGGVLAAYEFYQDWQFQAAARKGFGTKAGGYAQVGVKVEGAGGKAKMAKAEMV